ncbi:hypothetical protein Tco_0825213 [Tanacetum coccineum]
MEGDFPRLRLNDIEDMLLLVVQNKLFNLKGEDIVHLAATLHPQGVIYEDKLNRKRLMRSDELYKFSDGTLQSVRDTLHDMATNLRMRLCLADDLKEAQVHMQFKLKGTSSSLKSKDHYAYHKLKDKDSRPRAKTKDIRNMMIRGMLIPNEFITDDIHAIEEYKEYEKVFVMKKRKRKQVAGETSSSKPSLKFHVKQYKPSTTPIPSPSDDRERDKSAEATLLSLTMHKTAIAVKA